MTTDQLADRRQFYINGQWVDPTTPNDLEVINPSTEAACAVISLGSEADTNAAVAAAKAAFPGWSETPVEERIAMLERLADIYDARSAEMGEAISLEMGAPIDMAMTAQAGAGSWHLRNTIETLKNFAFEEPLGDHATHIGEGDELVLERRDALDRGRRQGALAVRLSDRGGRDRN